MPISNIAWFKLQTLTNIHQIHHFLSMQLRVVTQEDVRFSRFRRDDVGVFELKGMIEANTDRIADAESLLTDTSDAT
jgi:hypothetical protein